MDQNAYDLQSKAIVAKRGPYGVEVEEGKTYYFCTCGASKNQPWCDGSHKQLNEEKGTEFKSLKWTAEKNALVYMCGCKQSKILPLCDGAHRSLPPNAGMSAAAPKVDEKAYDLRTKAVVARSFPYGVKVEKGKTYYFCTCGASKKQPWCDGSHKQLNEEKGTEFKPLKYVPESSGMKLFCACKQSKTFPFCDGSHVVVIAKSSGFRYALGALLIAAVAAGAYVWLK